MANGLVKVALVGREKVEVTHIQYVDDSIFLVEGSKDNAEALRWLLKCFELVSGLSVNFDKSIAYGVNIRKEELKEMVMEWAVEWGFPQFHIWELMLEAECEALRCGKMMWRKLKGNLASGNPGNCR